MSVALKNGCYDSSYSRVTKNVDFTKILEAATKDLIFFCKIQFQLGNFRLSAFLYVLEQSLCLEGNEYEIPLALYIHLEYSHISESIRANDSLKQNLPLLYIN